MSNYPDNMAGSESDPRSPFYTPPPECEECGAELDIESDCDGDGVYTFTSCPNCDDQSEDE